MLILLSRIIGFPLMSGMMAAVDVALLSITCREIHKLVLQRKRGALALNPVREQGIRAMIVAVILTNTINLLGPILVSQHAVFRYGVFRYGVGSISLPRIVLTFGAVVASERVPRANGTRYTTVFGRRTDSDPAIELESNRGESGMAVRPVRQRPSKDWRGRPEPNIEDDWSHAGCIRHDEGHMIHCALTLKDGTAIEILAKGPGRRCAISSSRHRPRTAGDVPAAHATCSSGHDTGGQVPEVMCPR